MTKLRDNDYPVSFRDSLSKGGPFFSSGLQSKPVIARIQHNYFPGNFFRTMTSVEISLPPFSDHPEISELRDRSFYGATGYYVGCEEKQNPGIFPDATLSRADKFFEYPTVMDADTRAKRRK